MTCLQESSGNHFQQYNHTDWTISPTAYNILEQWKVGNRLWPTSDKIKKEFYFFHLKINTPFISEILNYIIVREEKSNKYIFTLYLDSRIKNECLDGRSCSVKLLSVPDIMKSISSRSDLIKDSCIGGKNYQEKTVLKTDLRCI